MMFLYSENKNCCGCTACYNICPSSAITIEEDEEGFLYPVIDENKCTNCGLCKNSCAWQNKPNYKLNYDKPFVFATKHKNSDVLMQSSSGGMFTVLSDYVLSLGGVVYGAAFDENFNTVHIRADTVEKRNLCRGSKYTQSEIGDTFRSIKSDLEKGLYVLFTGTPCQTAGLKAFMGVNEKRFEKQLYLCDLICHGTPSSMMFKEYIKYCEKTKHNKVIEYYHRAKNNKRGTFSKVVYKNGCKKKITILNKGWMNLFYSRAMLRPSCYNCIYTSLKRPSDITIADYWGIEQVMPEFSNKQGVSLVLINTVKGFELFDASKANLEIKESRIDDCIKYQTNLVKPSASRVNREAFWEIYRINGFESILKRYGKSSIKSKIEYIAVTVLGKVGLLGFARKILKR